MGISVQSTKWLFFPLFPDRIDFENVGFCGGRNTSEQGQEPTTNLTHIWPHR